MTATKRFVLDLPADQVDMLQARVAAGQFASASDLVSTVMTDETAAPWEHADLDWDRICADADEEELRVNAGLEHGSLVKDVFDALRLRLAEMAEEPRRQA